MRRRWTLLVCVAACGGPDPFLELQNVFGGADAGIDATVDEGGCFCFGDAGQEASLPPPPVVCPVSAPTAGATCSVPSYEDCEYGTSPSYRCNAHFACIDGTWQDISPTCNPPQDCSTVVDGGACTSAGESCGDPDAGTICACTSCGGGPTPFPIMGDGAPTGSVWRCFAPKPGCDVTRPPSGTACDLPDGSVCNYVQGSCCVGIIETCSGGVWLGDQTLPCP